MSKIQYFRSWQLLILLLKIMNYVSAENLTKSYGLKVLFKEISFNVNEGDKIAIVAKNGSGKSTLLKILMGKEIADSGNVVINKDIQVVLFDQEIDFEGELNVEEFMMTLDSAPIMALKNYHHALISENPDDMDKALNEMEIHEAWDLENEMSQILTQLKITDLQAKMKTLSGGQIKRVALAKLLVETRAQHRHTLLIMDEPTNHLDVDMVEWLENYLSKAEYIEMLNNENIKKIELNTIFAHKELERQKQIENTRRKHHIQYLIITLAIVFFIMTIITLSLYNMPKWWLKSMSFISFILLFEFIILIIDTKLHDWSHGDPYKILGAKVLIISLLLPFHHWAEKKFVDLLIRGEVSKFFKLIKKKIYPEKKEIHLGD